MNVIITVSASYPPTVGEVQQTLFGEITITPPMAASGYYNHTVSTQVAVQDGDSSPADLQAAINTAAANLATTLGGVPGTIPPTTNPF